MLPQFQSYHKYIHCQLRKEWVLDRSYNYNNEFPQNFRSCASEFQKTISIPTCLVQHTGRLYQMHRKKKGQGFTGSVGVGTE